MTTLPSMRPKSALLVIDVQNGVVANAYNNDGVVANIGLLVDKARAANVPVIWIQHHDDSLKKDTHAWRYVPELIAVSRPSRSFISRTSTHTNHYWRHHTAPGRRGGVAQTAKVDFVR